MVGPLLAQENCHQRQEINATLLIVKLRNVLIKLLFIKRYMTAIIYVASMSHLCIDVCRCS